MTLDELEILLAATRPYPPALRVAPDLFYRWCSEMQPVQRWTMPDREMPNVLAPFRPRPLLIMDERMAPGEFKADETQNAR